MKRVVVTGMAGISPIGNDWETISNNLKNGNTGIVKMDDWAKYEGMDTQLAGLVEDFEKPREFNRKITRSMGRVALMAAITTRNALEDANLLGNSDILSNGLTGVAFGSSTGSPPALADFGHMLSDYSTRGVNATSYLKMMPHTTAVNIGVHYKLRGRVYTTSSACTSGSQAIGYAYEAIRNGQQKVMLAGGAEELCPTEAAVFDTLFATSTKNETPELTPAPFDANRDGLVIGEGSATLILEELEHALERGADIYAEIIGFGTNADGSHVTQPNAETMRICMELALADADISPSDVGYINAHGTATDRGDTAESNATEAVYSSDTPISSLKSYTGHTLGACGALEAMTAIHCMNENWFYPTANLNEIDPACGNLDYIKGAVRELAVDNVVSNNFAFGGINTSLIFRRWKT
ncbi:3-oxoacyl-[acyl-carrier-protein] synthase 1 [BD1-7 clade bacterium]|uniref:3-oxoacyl-[acyl-carrier-protein] synthase 1 n=1 Tax=BD1-7 clade bacterium TaxID=2029982 RepID=A0A5S9PU15_9GAMM|nr:3-oxoacyl-[acyl-carrier-protein] synthase 1 [BD1-7 clade bacterium]